MHNRGVVVYEGHRIWMGIRVGVLALALVAMGACSNNAGSTNSSSTASGGATNPSGGATNDPFAGIAHVNAPSPCVLDPGVTASDIKVGSIAPETGVSAASFKPAEDGIKARLAMANQTHELGARTVSLRSVDDASDTAKNAEAARQLIEQDKVFSVIEISDKADGSAAYLNKANVPVVGWHVGVPVWGVDTNMFTFRQPASATPASEYTDRNVKVITRLGGTKVALVAGGNQSSVAFINRIASTLTPSSGASLVYKTTDVVIGSTEFTSVVQNIKDSGADSMVTGLDFLQNTALSSQLNKAGVHLKAIVFPGGYDPRVLKLPGIEGATFGLEFKPFEQQIKDGTKSYKDFDTYLPKDVVRSQLTYIGWLSANLFIDGLKQAGTDCPTRKAFISNLRLEKGYSADGAFDPIDLTADFGHEFKCAYYVTVQNGQFVPNFDGQPVCGSLVKINGS